MSFSGTKFIKSLLIIYSSFQLVFTSGWFQIFEDADQLRINAATQGHNGLSTIYAVGEGGYYYATENGGFNWSTEFVGIDANLTSIATGEDFQNSNNRVHIVVSDGGTIARYDEALDAWEINNALATGSLNVSCFDKNMSRFWIAGDAGQAWYSDDFGRNWTEQPFDQSVNIRRIVPSYNGLFMFAEKNDSTFIFRESQVAGIYYSALGDTLPGLKLINAVLPEGEYTDNIYILGFENDATVAHLWEMNVYGTPGNAYNELFAGDLGPVSDLALWGMDGFVFWVSTLDGRIWESRNYGATWSQNYNDPLGGEIGPVLASNYDFDHGRAFGANGRVLKYGFELTYIWPYINDNMSSNFNQFELKFSLPPDEASLQSGIKIESNQRGNIPFTVQIAPGDSNLAYLELNSDFGPEQVPGEKMSVSLSDSIFARNTFSADIFPGHSYSINIVSPKATSFRFNSNYNFPGIGQSTSNWVSGFLNKDDVLDLMTLAGDTLFFFLGADDGTYDQVIKQSLSGLVYSDINMAEQILLMDFNSDGLQDVLIYSSANIYMFINNSTTSDVAFTGPTASWSDEVIYKVIPYNLNNNKHPDVLVFGIGLYSRLDLTVDTFGSSTILHETGAASHQDVDIADINADGRPDMVILDSDGLLVLRQGFGNGYFDQSGQVYPGSSSYDGFKVADLDGDHQLEVLAYNGVNLDLFSLDLGAPWSFDGSVTGIIQTGQTPILDIYIQEFGGNRASDMEIRMDLLVLTTEQILFYENTTDQQKVFSLNHLDTFDKAIDTPFDFLLAGDFNKDASLDFAAYDVAIGQFEIWNKFNWNPKIENYSIGNRQINLSWEPLPSEAGILDYYRIVRDTIPEFNEMSYIRESDISQFTDYEIGMFESFYYAVQAVYNGGFESEWSDTIHVETYFELNGPQAGVLEDTTRPYLARTPISVESGASLVIREGIQIGFENNTRFDVYGNLIVQGVNEEKGMVDFQSAGWETGIWDGIVFHPAADTVYLEWFSVFGARDGITVNGRPLKMKFAGIIQNEVGLRCNSDTLNVQNVIFDSNYVALQIDGNTHAEIKNVNILHSRDNSILAQGSSRVGVRNSIIWDNRGPAVRAASSAFLGIKYSTVDSMSVNVIKTEISNLPPIFFPSDSLFYQVDVFSPTIDAGDPGDDFSQEPLPNGNRINQGLYGGSDMATPSYQPRLQLPQIDVMTARLGMSDTTQLVLKNFGGSELQITSIKLSENSDVFELVGAAAITLLPGDSSTMELVFTPIERGNYQIRIDFYCNDPHLEGGLSSLNVYGVGSDVVPIVKLDPIPSLTIKSSAVRFWFSVVDSSISISQPSEPKTYRVNYVLANITTLDTVETGILGTSDHLDFYGLDDGKYLLKIWANSVPGTDMNDRHRKLQYFQVDVKRRTVLPLRWYMVSLPTNVPIDWSWFEIGDSSAYLVQWDNLEREYIPLDIKNIPAVQGFWTFSIRTFSLDMDMVNAVEPAQEIPLDMPKPLQRGWNQMGIPMDFDVFWHEMDIITQDGIRLRFLDAVEQRILDGVVYRFTQTSDFQGYDWNVVDSTTKAVPWVGYWLNTYQECEVIYPDFPAFDNRVISADIEPASVLAKKPEQQMEWKINLSLQNEFYSDAKNIFGIGNPTVNEVSEPPHIGDFCALVVPSEKGDLTQKIYPSFADNSEVKIWNIQVQTRNSSISHSLSWDIEESQNAGVYLYLVDAQSEQVMNLTDIESYVFTPKGNSSQFTLYATRDETFEPEIVPLSFKLEQNYPNPFNPQTSIRFGIPAAAAEHIVTLNVYDVLGKKVSEIFNGQLKSGYHEFVWNGRNIHQKPAASGVYFYQLKSGKHIAVRKMVLLR